MPWQIERKLKTGKITEAKAKTMAKWVWPMALVLIGYGIFRIFAG
jgi:hypothetical protein